MYSFSVYPVDKESLAEVYIELYWNVLQYYSQCFIWKEEMGCEIDGIDPMKHDSRCIVLYVFFLAVYFILLIKLLLKYILLWNQFYHNIISIKYLSLFFLVLNKWTIYGIFNYSSTVVFRWDNLYIGEMHSA